MFLHARVPKEVLQKFIPESLTIEEYDGSAWLGFVPFSMSGIRPSWFTAVPWLSRFHETNLRTYVTHPEYGPGVWFFSLEAARFLACLIARQGFKLPYFHARLSRNIQDDVWHYEGKRNRRQALPSLACTSSLLDEYSVTVKREGDWTEAESRTFEYWLAERYRLYSLGSQGRIVTAKVFHEPYQLASGSLIELSVKGLDDQFGQLDFSSVLLAKTLNVECFSPTLI